MVVNANGYNTTNAFTGILVCAKYYQVALERTYSMNCALGVWTRICCVVCIICLISKWKLIPAILEIPVENTLPYWCLCVQFWVILCILRPLNKPWQVVYSQNDIGIFFRTTVFGVSIAVFKPVMTSVLV